MDFPNKQHSLNRTWGAIALTIASALLLAPASGHAQVPYNIDGVVPDADCCFEFLDPVGSISELGPVNSSDTKLTSIGSASPPMLGFTNPNRDRKSVV